jgi:hypothetical protein
MHRADLSGEVLVHQMTQLKTNLLFGYMTIGGVFIDTSVFIVYV